MKIISLQSENVKRLKAVEIKPDGHAVIIGGKNGAGKSSVLDSIAYALGGKKLCPKVPIRKGKETAEVRVEFDEDLVVTRRWTVAGGTSLIVESKDGARHKSPQRVLDDLVGRLSFDPLDFSRQSPDEQLETVRALVGLDLSPFDGAYDRAYHKRRDVNRDLRQMSGTLESLERHDDAPAEEVSVKGLLAELDERRTYNAKNATIRRTLTDAEENVSDCNANVRKHRDAIADLERQLEAVKKGETVAVEEWKKWQDTEHVRRANAERLADQDLDEVREQINGAEAINAKVRDNVQHTKVQAKVDELTAKSEGLTAQIEKATADRAEAIAAAEYPIEGLTVGDGCVLFNGLPLEQASSAELLRVSGAMGFALNPKLPVLLIRDGSLLDEENLALFAEMAAEKDGQVWLERVGDSDGTATVIIEDGTVRGEGDPIPPGGAA